MFYDHGRLSGNMRNGILEVLTRAALNSFSMMEVPVDEKRSSLITSWPLGIVIHPHRLLRCCLNGISRRRHGSEGAVVTQSIEESPVRCLMAGWNTHAQTTAWSQSEL